MKKAQIQIGGVYVAKVSGKLANVRIDGESPYGGWDAVNLDTRKKIRIRGAQRLRCAIGPSTGVATPKPQRRNAMNENPMNENDDVGGAADSDVCATLGCGRAATITHLGRPRCRECWESECQDEGQAPAAAPTAEIVAGQAAPKPAGKPKRLSALDAAVEVLRTATEPMASKALIAEMTEKGLWSSPHGKTPDATLYAAILREINAKGATARFRKTERGKFALRDSQYIREQAAKAARQK